MTTKRLTALRVMVIPILALLGIQYELGIAVNMADSASIPPISFSIPNVSDALHGVGSVALWHAGLGGTLAILSLIGVVMSLMSKVRSLQIFGTLGFLSMLLAATGGLLFVVSGFQDDGYSHAMATNFILTFSFYFLELYFLKPDSRAQKN